MVWKAAVASIALVAATGGDGLTRDNQRIAEKMGVFDSNPQPAPGLPSHAIRCPFTERSYCVGGECRTVPVRNVEMYVEIDAGAGTYKRCGPKPNDCGTHKITYVGDSGAYRNVVVGTAGTLFKYNNSGHFTDIATQGPQTFVSDGKCVPAK